MNEQTTACPPKAALADFGLGKLDRRRAETIGRHLETCVDCQRFVASVSGDDFVARLKHAWPPGASPAGGARPSGEPVPAGPQRSQSIAGRGQSLAFPAGAPGAQPSDLAAPPELVNHPDYELIKELGRGGMGVVYLARNRMLDRLEVLKVVSRALLDRPGAIERFQQEIRAAARLQHPNIVAAHSALRVGDLLVLAMEYVPGEDLSRVVARRGALPIVNAAYYAQQAALGLQHAHEKGMVHRDIKPDNLILAQDGKNHIVKILDFGLAKATSEKQAEGGLTRTGQMLGTPDYVAPEQMLDAQKADIRADIYSLGCTLYYLLAGRPPFDGNSLYEILQAHHKGSARPLNELRPDVPVELATVVAYMMARRPAERYQTPGDVAQALQPFFMPNATSPAGSPQAPPITSLQSPGAMPAPSGSVPAPVAPISVETQAPRSSAAPVVLAAATKTSSPRISTLAGNKVAAPRRSWSKRRSGVSLPRSRAIVIIAGIAIPVLLLANSLFFRKTEGVISLIVNEPHVDVRVDGEGVPIAWNDGGKTAELRLTTGSHRIEIRKDGFEINGEDMTIENGGHKTLAIRLAPAAAMNRAKPRAESRSIAGATTPSAAPETAAVGATGVAFAPGVSVTPGASPSSSVASVEATAPSDSRGSGVYKWPPDQPPPAIAPFDAQQARAQQEAWGKYLGVPVEQKNSLGMTLALIPPGEFLMGSTPEQRAAGEKRAEDAKLSPNSWELARLKEEVPQHRVALSRPFLLGTTEVTIGQFRRFVDATKYATEAEQFGFGSSHLKTADATITREQKKITWREPGYVVSDDFPVEQVTWNDAVRFCNWLSEHEGLNVCYRQDGDQWILLGTANGYRLPTEAEWEYACRAGSTTQFWFGDDVADLERHDWHGKNAGRRAWAVGTKSANPFGLFDMHGNVREWCSDYYDYKYYEKSPTKDPFCASGGPARVSRGGAWYYPAVCCRSASRFFYLPVSCSFIGLRLARVEGIWPGVDWTRLSVSQDLKDPPRTGRWQTDAAATAPSGDNRLPRVTASDPAAPQEGILYQIVNAQSGMALSAAGKDASALIQTARKPSSAQQWSLKRFGDRFQLINSLSHLLANVRGGYATSGVQIIQYRNQGGGGNELWLFQRRGDWHEIIAEHGLVLSVANASQDRSEIVQVNRRGSDDEIWSLIPVPHLVVSPFNAQQARANQEAWGTYLGLPVETTSSIGMRLTLIPPGEFMMGSSKREKPFGSDEGPERRVRITNSFYLGVYEVTQEEYQAVTGTNPSFFSSTGDLKEQVAGLDTRRFPVDQVCWEDATEFCRELSAREGKRYRLPTEAEWEYACRAGTTTAFSSGSALSRDDANYWKSATGPYLDRPTTVGSYPPNAFGLYDMHGNVYEWCSDWYDKGYYAISPADDPQGPSAGSSRVLRGGAWNSSPVTCRSARRVNHRPAVRDSELGFRVVCEP